MSTTGKPTAKPPFSPFFNLRITKRAGTTRDYSAIWHIVCACGRTFTADAPAIKRGAARCPVCNPSRGMLQANLILAALPATYAQLERRTGLTYGQIKYRLTWMRERDLYHIGDWDRPSQQGAFAPIFHAGQGEDAPCDLIPRSRLSLERRYRKRVKRAIEQAVAGGKEDPRYVRHIALHAAKKTAERARKEPQTPWSALFAVAKVQTMKAEA